MSPFKRKITLRVLAIHVAVMLFLFLQSALQGCFHPKPKPEIVTFIQFGQPAPAVNVQEVAHLAEPEPAPSEPTPAKTIVPEPAKPKPKPLPKPKPKVAEPTPAPKPKPVPAPEPVKPKWTPTKVDPTKSKRIEPKVAKPTISEQDIEKTLSGIVSPSSPTTASTGNPSEFSAYDSQIYALFYGAWKQPATAASRPATVQISIDSNGRITGRKLAQGSGDSSFDQTAMDAVNSVSMLPRPPAGYPLKDIVIQFRLVD